MSRFTQPVPFWLTINEPSVYVLQCYINGAWPPQRRADFLGGARAFWNLARAHRVARRIVKQYRPTEQISFAHNALLMEPCDSSRVADRMATWLRDWLYNRVFFLLLGGARRSCDFIGLNYYTRCSVRSEGSLLTRIFGRACKVAHHPSQGVVSDLGWGELPTGPWKDTRSFRQVRTTSVHYRERFRNRERRSESPVPTPAHQRSETSPGER